MTHNELEAEVESLKKVISDICNEVYEMFEDKPNSKGMYFHMGICSASRYKPIGTYGCCCKNAKIFKRMHNPHNWVLLEKTRIPERGLNWDTYECSKCKWGATYNPDMGIEELNKAGWCPVYE